MLSPTFTRRACVPVALALALGLSSCSSKDEEPAGPSETAPQNTETAAETSEPDASGESPAQTETTGETGTSETTATSTSGRWLGGGGGDKLEEVRETFASLAPESLFDALDTCTETSLRRSYDCSGKDIGQFQFFESEPMAKDTANVLEGLKSSTIVEETEDKLVGWSMIGRTAVITVVDVAEGTVLQQMMSSEVEDPRERIYELGLAERKGGADSSGASASTSEPASEAKKL